MLHAILTLFYSLTWTLTTTYNTCAVALQVGITQTLDWYQGLWFLVIKIWVPAKLNNGDNIDPGDTMDNNGQQWTTGIIT